MTRFRYGMAALAAVAFMISGCGGGGESSMSDSGGTARSVAAPVAPAAGGTEGAGVRSYAKREPAPLAEDARAGADTTRDQAPLKMEPVDRSIVYTAELTVRATDVAAAADKAKQLVTTAGGYVAEEKSDSYSRRDEAVITFKIPPARYQDVLAQLGRDLGKRESLHQGAQDVTEEVADVDSRVRSAKSTLDQFRTLLSKAGKIGEILEIEREISSREADLEALQARQKALAAQTGMATVTLTLAGPAAAPAKPKEKESGFISGLKGGWRALVTSTEVALTVLGALLPWLVIVAVVWLVVALVLRRGRPRRTAGASPAPSSTPSPVPPSPRLESRTAEPAHSAAAHSPGRQPGSPTPEQQEPHEHGRE
ncbi:DUF4349 domain-containing protein [Planotetraspora sp. A-T 1434]|uniref:DUF4349 domain-containing protein n=1 Tax=Planotetraspora sp. A-T 1434 TaxID=2979219 RepID=UPI0021C02AF7|nr:DUF4349 domain-containing protein [Planotetraspora sp. A-T 1434]MCT9929474.1 DUF4349 domain-containing protein [Planotetraspora sp. A-T 1434]